MLDALFEIGTIFAVLAGAYWLVAKGTAAARGVASGLGVGAARMGRDSRDAAGWAYRKLKTVPWWKALPVEVKLPVEALPAKMPVKAPISKERAIRQGVSHLREQIAAEMAELSKGSNTQGRVQKGAPEAKGAGKANPARRQALPKKVPASVSAEAMDELDAMIGLEGIKARVREIGNMAWMERERKRRGMKPGKTSFHMAFTGNPGTGKTVVARIIGRIFAELGLLKKGHVVETNRSGLVAEFVGQSAPKVDEVVEKALGGVLFIDEAYLLAPEDPSKDFGKEAIGALIEHMENKRGELIVIAAGYPKDMDRLLRSNPGMKSRMATVIDFPDYSEEELFEIFRKICRDNHYLLDEGAEDEVRDVIAEIYRGREEHFGNGREMRNLFERCVMRLGGRLREAAGELVDEDFFMLRVGDIREESHEPAHPEDPQRAEALEEEIERQREERRKLKARLKEIGGEIDDLEVKGDD